MPAPRPARTFGAADVIMGSVLATVLFTATACGGAAAPAQGPPSVAATADSLETATAPADEDTAPLDGEGVPDPGNASLAGNVQPNYAATAVDVLASLPIKGRAPKTGYSREEFGQAWADVDRNGCDTRNDILARDLEAKTFKPGTRDCVVLTGVLKDPYTASTIGFVRGQDTSSAVQIDHVVALNDAWQKGAQKLSLEQRTALANDPLNLLAADGPSNQQKGASDAATWLPPNKSYRCEYVARQISVKATYKLWVTQAEHDAMATVLGTCSDTPAPTNQSAPSTPTAEQAPLILPPVAPIIAPAPLAEAPVPAAPPAAPIAPLVDAPAAVYYANCSAVRAAGAAPILASQPGFQAKFDRDNDGVGCE